MRNQLLCTYFTTPPTGHGNLSPPRAVLKSCDIGAVAMRRDKRCLWFYRTWSFSQVPKRFGIFLFSVLKWKISNSSLCITKKPKNSLTAFPLHLYSGLALSRTTGKPPLCHQGLRWERAGVRRSDMQTHPHASLWSLTHPRVIGRGPRDNDEPTCGGVLPNFLSVGFHGALKKKKKKAFYRK